jgi:hypothetical protein
MQMPVLKKIRVNINVALYIGSSLKNSCVSVIPCISGMKITTIRNASKENMIPLNKAIGIMSLDLIPV